MQLKKALMRYHRFYKWNFTSSKNAIEKRTAEKKKNNEKKLKLGSHHARTDSKRMGTGFFWKTEAEYGLWLKKKKQFSAVGNDGTAFVPVLG